MNVVEKARLVATAAHNGARQVRKVTGEPYINHPAMVAATARAFHAYFKAEDRPADTTYWPMIDDDVECLEAAAWLHDTVEDTGLDFAFIKEEFPNEVYFLVRLLTDLKSEDHTREERLDAYIKTLNSSIHGQRVRFLAQLLKLADISANFKDIMASHENPDPKQQFNNYERFIREKTKIINSFPEFKNTQVAKTLLANMDNFLIAKTAKKGNYGQAV